MSRVLKFRAFFNGQMSSPFHLGEGVCWPDGRVSTANKVGEVMQFTGLLDKNGVEVYEDDVLSWDGSVIGKVSFDNCEFIVGSGVNARAMCAVGDRDILVIGNIHEHPHLIDSK